MKLLIFLGELQVLRIYFQKFRILEILNFDPCIPDGPFFYFEVHMHAFFQEILLKNQCPLEKMERNMKNGWNLGMAVSVVLLSKYQEGRPVFVTHAYSRV